MVINTRFVCWRRLVQFSMHPHCCTATYMALRLILCLTGLLVVRDSGDNDSPQVAPWEGGPGGTTHRCRRPTRSSTHVLLQQVVQHAMQPSGPPTPISDASSSVTTAISTAVSRGSVVLPGPHELVGGADAVPPEDRWFACHWFWLRFRDAELEKRYTWWHSRQSVTVR